MNLLRPEFDQRPVDGELQVHGALARGPAVATFLRRMLAEEDDRLGQLRGVASETIAVVTGPAEALPWFDGVVYLRRTAEEPGLLLPTWSVSRVPIPAFFRAVSRVSPELRLPIVAVPDEQRLVSLAEARVPDRATLTRLLETVGG